MVIDKEPLNRDQEKDAQIKDSNNDIDKPGGFYPNNMFLEPFNFTNPIKDISDLIKNKELEKEYGNLIIFNIQEQKI